MNESSQAKENPVCLWVPSSSNCYLLETSINSCRKANADAVICILEETKDPIDKTILEKINPDHHLNSIDEGVSSRKGWDNVKGLLISIFRLCTTHNYSGVYVFNHTTVLSSPPEGINNTFSYFNKNIGLGGYRNKGLPVVDPAFYWISLECVKSCITYMKYKKITMDKNSSENIILSLVAFATGNYVRLYEEDHITLYHEINETTVSPIMDFRNAFTIYTNKLDRQKLIKEKAATL